MGVATMAKMAKMRIINSQEQENKVLETLSRDFA